MMLISLVFSAFSLATAQVIIIANSTLPSPLLSPKSICHFDLSHGSNLTVTETDFIKAIKELKGEASKRQYRAFAAAIKASKIDSKREVAMFLAHAWHSTNGFKDKREPKCMKDMGKCCKKKHYKHKDKKGRVYYGRGYLMLKKFENYKKISEELFKNSRLLDSPELVAEDECIAWRTSTLLWDQKVHSNKEAVKKGKFGLTTKLLYHKECKSGDKKANEEARMRFKHYKKILKGFGINDKPIESGCYN